MIPFDSSKICCHLRHSLCITDDDLESGSKGALLLERSEILRQVLVSVTATDDESQLYDLPKSTVFT